MLKKNVYQDIGKNDAQYHAANNDRDIFGMMEQEPDERVAGFALHC